MRYLEFVKRIVPFVLTFAVGLFVASLVLGLTGQANTNSTRSYKSSERYESFKLKMENRRLKRENCRLKWERKMRERREAKQKKDIINLVPPVVVEKK